MGKGVPFLEAREKNHFIRVDPPEWEQALAVLDDAQAFGTSISAAARQGAPA
jgi:transketolase